MSNSHTTNPWTSVFDQIEDVLGRTARGRAFLAECERRGRSEEVGLLLDAVARLERRARERTETLDRDELRSLIAQVEGGLRDARLAFFRSIDRGHRTILPAEPPSPAALAQDATASIFAAAELVQETSWMMREAGFDGALCDRLEEQTTAIYEACRAQARLLEGLFTVERALGRADASLAELRRTVTPTPPTPLAPLDGRGPLTLVGDDVEFVVTPLRDDPPD